MKINYANIKLEFLKFLAESSKADIDLNKLDDISIFSYSNDFKDFVSEKYNLDDSIFSLDLEQLLSYSFSDGKLSDNTNGDENQFTLDYLNDLLSDKDIQEAIDTNNNGIIEEEEVKNFFSNAAGLDGNASDFSDSDIKNVFAQIENDDFTLGDFKTSSTPKTSKTSGSSGSSSSRTSTSTNSDTSADKTSTSSEARLGNMSVEQLNNEKSNALAERNEQYDLINQINNGEGPVAKSKEAMDNAFDKMETELAKLDSELAEEYRSAKNDREAKEQAVNENDTGIAKKTAEKSDAQADLDSANSNIASIESCIDGLKSQLSSAETAEEKAVINGKLSEANTKLQQAKKAQEKAQAALDKADEELTKLTSQSAQLKADLETAQTREADAEGKVNELAGQNGNKTLKFFKNAYDTAKTNYETEKANAVTNAKNAIKEKQEYINKINAQIPETQAKENTRSLKANTSTEQDIEDTIDAIGGNAKNLEITKAADGSYDVTEITQDGMEVKYTFDADGKMTSYQNSMGTFKADGDKVILTNDNNQMKKWSSATDSYTIDASLEDVVSQIRKSSPQAESFINAALNSYNAFPGHGSSNYCVRYTDYVYSQITGQGLGVRTKDYQSLDEVSYDNVQTGDVYNEKAHIGMVLLHIKDRNGQNVFLTADYSASRVTMNIRDENDSPKKNGKRQSLLSDTTTFYRGWLKG